MKRLLPFFLTSLMSLGVLATRNHNDVLHSSIVENANHNKIKMEVLAFPNPMSINSVVGYNLAQRATVEISMYDCEGRLVSVLLKESQLAGKHQFFFERKNLKAGLYYLNVNAGIQVGSASIAIVD